MFRSSAPTRALHYKPPGSRLVATALPLTAAARTARGAYRYKCDREVGRLPNDRDRQWEARPADEDQLCVLAPRESAEELITSANTRSACQNATVVQRCEAVRKGPKAVPCQPACETCAEPLELGPQIPATHA